MLSKFFQVQWKYPTRGDWVEDVRKDLKDFGIDESLEFIKSKSEYSFKNMVKKKAHEYAFYSLLGKKERHSKLFKFFLYKTWHPTLPGRWTPDKGTGTDILQL